MRKHILLLVILLSLLPVSMAHATDPDSTQILESRIDSIEKSFTYQHGTITLDGGIGTLTVPAGFKYLDPKQAEYVLSDLWGNPKSTSLGMLVPENMGILQANCWVFEIQYEEIGYVEDDDADDIDYDELLTQIKEDVKEENKTRTAEGYPAVEMIGWASKPYYDSERKILHWAKEVRFGEDEVNTLNYNVRVLGRKGVLVINAIASMNQLAEVNKQVPQVLNIVQFAEGYKYSDFNPNIDNVAAWTIGGLVAGKVIAKTGILAGILAFFGKFFKIILIAMAGGFSALWRWLTGRRKQEAEETYTYETTADTTSADDALHTPQTSITAATTSEYAAEATPEGPSSTPKE